MARATKARQPARQQGQPGLIVSHYGVAVLVRFDADGREEPVKVKRNSDHVVGDRVLVAGERVSSLERRNALRRRDPFGKVRTLAANLDVLGIVVAVRPETPPGLIEKAVVAARAAHMEPALIVNKCDLPGSEALVARLQADFPGIACICQVSAHRGDGVAELQQLLAERGRGAFVGVSGSGKSSLMNTLCPGIALETGELNEDDHGCHTTSVSTLIALPSGGELVDTPGFRDFSPVDVSSEEIALWYPGLMTILERQPCRFRNCRHRQEPGCAVKLAVESGDLAVQRYDLYLQTLTELEQVESAAVTRRKGLPPR
ncbi:MAG: ribosome small subunit-dependent GTPase A [Desulfuromonas sp.]|nr:MAG: ribosome small subunit-dependent GTPase A [Desulfuromonas sp.]